MKVHTIKLNDVINNDRWFIHYQQENILILRYAVNVKTFVPIVQVTDKRKCMTGNFQGQEIVSK